MVDRLIPIFFSLWYWKPSTVVATSRCIIPSSNTIALKTIRFNTLYYIPDKDIFREAMLLFRDEFSDCLNDHVKSEYSKPDKPWKLGGRTDGLQGQVGSNNGSEKRGGIWKNNFRSIVIKVPTEDKNNFIHIFEAIALDDHSEFQGKNGRFKFRWF